MSNNISFSYSFDLGSAFFFLCPLPFIQNIFSFLFVFQKFIAGKLIRKPQYFNHTTIKSFDRDCPHWLVIVCLISTRIKYSKKNWQLFKNIFILQFSIFTCIFVCWNILVHLSIYSVNNNSIDSCC